MQVQVLFYLHQGGYVFLCVHLFVGWLVCQLRYTKTFGSDPDKRADTAFYKKHFC